MGIQVLFYLTASEFKARAHILKGKCYFYTKVLIFNVLGDFIATFPPTPYLGDMSGFIFNSKHSRNFGGMGVTHCDIQIS